MQVGWYPPTKFANCKHSPVIWGYLWTAPRHWQQDQVKADAVCFAQKSPVYYHGCGECWLGMSLRIMSSPWAAAGVCQFYQHLFLPPMHAHTDLSQLLQFRTSLCCPLHQDQKREGASSRLCQYQEVASFPRLSTWLPGNEATSRGIHLHFICTSIRNWDQNLDWHKRTPGLLAFTYRTKWKPHLLVNYYQICDCDNRWSLPLVQKFTVLCNFWWYPYQHKPHLVLHLRSDPPW